MEEPDQRCEEKLDFFSESVRMMKKHDSQMGVKKRAEKDSARG